MDAAAITALPSGTSAINTLTAPANSQLSSDFEVFLTMLTAQLENQDPLNPVDATDYATQLATFSSVEQQVRTNDLLVALGQQFGEMGLAQLAGWVGMEARVAAPAYFDGAPLTLYPGTAASADDAALVVRDAAGLVVSRQPILLDDQPFDWAGTDDFGGPLAPGTYSFSIESYSNGQVIDVSVAETYALVGEAKFTNGRTIVVLAGGVQVPVSDISALRAPIG